MKIQIGDIWEFKTSRDKWYKRPDLFSLEAAKEVVKVTGMLYDNGKTIVIMKSVKSRSGMLKTGTAYQENAKVMENGQLWRYLGRDYNV